MSIGVGEGIELSATACTLLNNNKLGVSTYITTLKRTSLNSHLCIYCLRQTSKFHHQASFQKSQFVNMPFPSFPGPLYQNEVKCSACDMKMTFHSHANKTHFHKKGWALGLILKVRVLGTREWSIVLKRILMYKESKCKKKMFTNDAWWWNLLVWRKHA